MIRFNEKLVKAAQETERIGSEESPISQLFTFAPRQFKQERELARDRGIGRVILTLSLLSFPILSK